ncbi:MAG: hypothetical protein ACTSVC_10960 [Promethearchaeota archaeon]
MRPPGFNPPSPPGMQPPSPPITSPSTPEITKTPPPITHTKNSVKSVKIRKTMICPICGFALKGYEKVCPNCKSRLK